MPQNTAVPSAMRISAPAPVAMYERHHAQDEGERGHQDRPQAQAGRPRPPPGTRSMPCSSQLAGELDDQDGVLGRQADQHDEADLREDVVVHARAA